MFALPLLELFDQWFDRHAVDLSDYPSYAFPDKWLAFGYYNTYTFPSLRLRWFRMKLPIRTYGPLFELGMRGYGFREHWLQWFEGYHSTVLPQFRGPHIWPPFGE